MSEFLVGLLFGYLVCRDGLVPRHVEDGVVLVLVVLVVAEVVVRLVRR